MLLKASGFRWPPDLTVREVYWLSSQHFSVLLTVLVAGTSCFCLDWGY